MDKFKTCQDCKERQLHCHSTCEGYKFRQVQQEEIRKKRYRINGFWYGRIWKKEFKARKRKTDE